MAYGNGININTGFDLGSEKPLDSRTVVDTIIERDKLVTDGLAYPSLQVYVKETGIRYEYQEDGSWSEIATYTKQKILNLLGISEAGLEFLSDGINDEEITTNKTWSSNKIYTEISNLETNIPTKTSELANDSNYVTNEDLNDCIKSITLDDLSDVDVVGATDGQVLSYDQSSNKFILKNDSNATILGEAKEYTDKKVSNLSLFTAIIVDSKPTYADGIITYVENGTQKTTENELTWFLYDVDGVCTQTIFLNGIEKTIQNSNVNLSNYVAKSDVITEYDGVSILDDDEICGAGCLRQMHNKLAEELNKKALAEDVTEHNTNEDIHVTTEDKVKWNTVDSKVDKTSIVDTYNVNVTNEQTFGAKVMYSKLAEGFNGVLRQGLTTENNDMNNLITPGQYETVWNTANYTNLPPVKKGATRMRIKVEQLSQNCYRQEVGFQAGAVSQGVWYRFFVDNTWSVWKKIATSTVEDIGRTKLTYSVVDNYKSAEDSRNWYEVKNGICYFQLCTTVVAPSGGIKAITGMPPPRTSDVYYCNSYSNPTGSYLSINIGSAGVVYFTGGTTNSNYMYTGSYIIAE